MHVELHAKYLLLLGPGATALTSLATVSSLPAVTACLGAMSTVAAMLAGKVAPGDARAKSCATFSTAGRGGGKATAAAAAFEAATSSTVGSLTGAAGTAGELEVFEDKSEAQVSTSIENSAAGACCTGTGSVCSRTFSAASLGRFWNNKA